uniref:Uncharacterized protein n=1 Tax=Helianthus annuus TaxID=4232 RepID=A0A251SFC4_HELAN
MLTPLAPVGYFRIYLSIVDTLDPYIHIFPRLSTLVPPKYSFSRLELMTRVYTLLDTNFQGVTDVLAFDATYSTNRLVPPP